MESNELDARLNITYTHRHIQIHMYTKTTMRMALTHWQSCRTVEFIYKESSCSYRHAVLFTAAVSFSVFCCCCCCRRCLSPFPFFVFLTLLCCFLLNVHFLLLSSLPNTHNLSLFFSFFKIFLFGFVWLKST